ncbi:hypothetical protein BN12_150045 [Nostocoides japonicum T1-X7]|uniref:Uncharacterized protein n=1 Tax=Nostocoides japonicum T1-X7 TaxID=1194083 RepID=A0A077LTY6_9MICO|nr:hypothetical protein BN12_150045 [Tetrasphaera japonica T1-X7]
MTRPTPAACAISATDASGSARKVLMVDATIAARFLRASARRGSAGRCPEARGAAAIPSLAGLRTTGTPSFLEQECTGYCSR